MNKQISQIALIKDLRGSLTIGSVTFADIVLCTSLLLAPPFLSLANLSEWSPPLLHLPLLLETYFTKPPPIKVSLKHAHLEVFLPV